MIEKRRKAVHLSSVHSPNDNRIFHKQCRTLVEAGYDVVLVIPSGGDEELDGVVIRSVPPPRHRLSRMLVTTWRVFRAALAENGDIYHFHDPELIPYGLLLRLMGKIVIYDIHEDYVTSIRQKGYLPRFITALLASLFDWFESLATRAFVIILAERYYARRFPSGHHVLNYPRLDYFRRDDVGLKRPSSGLRKEGTVKRLIYTGGVSIDRGAFVYAKMVAMIPDIEITLVGQCSPPLAESLRTIAGRGASRLTIIGEGYHVPFKEIATFYRSEQWTAGLAIFPETPHYTEKELTKFFEYMAAGIPVLCSNFPVWNALIEGNGVGLCVDPEDVQEIAEAISELARQPQLGLEMGQRGRAAVHRRYNWDVEGERLVEIYQFLLR